MPTLDNADREAITTTSNERRFALVVGANNSVVPNAREVLRYAEQDASEMAWALQELYCNFTAKTLRGEDARSGDVRQAIIDLVKEKTDKDFLLFYFSGHAQPMETAGGHKDIYLVTHNFSESDEELVPGTHLSMRWLKNVLYERTRAGAVLLILDCCYAGNIIPTGPDRYIVDFGKLMEEWLEEGNVSGQKDAPRAILTATGYNIPAQEKDGHGRMTYWLLRALRGDDKVGNNGKLDLHSLHEYLKNKVPEQAPNLAGVFGQYHWILANHPGSILTILDRRYLETHQQLPFDHSLCYGASFADLDPKQVKAFSQQQRVQHSDLFQPDISAEALFTRFQFLEQGHPTYGALLCFGQRPLSLVPGAMTRCVRWNGIKRGDTLDIFEYSSSLLRQFELSRNFLQKNLGLRRVINQEGLERTTEEWEIPLRALEEALANALVHREYLNRMDNIYVEVYDDRVEITSPGKLPSSISVDQLLDNHDSQPRNPQIAGIFFLHNYIEKFGTGIQRMQGFMKKAELPEPLFHINEAQERFTVILYRPIPTDFQQPVPTNLVEAPLADQQQLSMEPAQISQTIWNIPFERNPLFTGREDILRQLHDALSKDRAAALTQPTQAISGLGGIGKTQTAIEYAYRYRDEYRYVFWVRAETQQELASDYTTIADLLHLLQSNQPNQDQKITGVKRWLQNHSDWLLILDNADDLQQAQSFLPTGGTGHIILTTRAQAIGKLAQRVEIERMEPEEGVLFLLRRARLIAEDTTIEQASSSAQALALAIVQEVDGLPLALDQAAAYIEETSCGLDGYLQRYRAQRATLLKRRSHTPNPDYRETVATTWTLAFQKVEAASPAAADLLRLCAFLSPDAIPEEIITNSTANLGPNLKSLSKPFQLNAAIEALSTYSLINRDPDTHILSLHRLVQAVLLDNMSKRTQRTWAERSIRAANKVFPRVEYATWPQCQRLLPSAQSCVTLIEQHQLVSREAANLLNNVAQYLQDQGQYTQALPLFQHTLHMRELTLESTHPDVAQSLNNLARLYDVLGLYAEAEPLYQRALAICELTLGPEHPDVAQSLNNLARLYDALGLYAEAEPLYQRALMIDEKILGPEHPDVAIDLNNLALLYYYQGEYAKAEPLYQRALMIDEQVLGLEHPEVATDLHNLASLYQAQNKYMMAEALFKQAVALKEKILGLEHPDLAASLHNLAKLHELRGNYEQAEELYRKVLAIFEKALGSEHPNVATVSANYAGLLQKMGRTVEADKLEERSREVQVKYVEENENPT